MTPKITAENKIIDIPDLNRFQIGDQVIVDASDVNDRFEGVIIGIEMRRIYGHSVLTPCITLLHDGYITDEFKPIDCRKVEAPAPQHTVSDVFAVTDGGNSITLHFAEIKSAKAFRESLPVAATPAPQHISVGDSQPRYTTKRLHDEIDKAKAFARREALDVLRRAERFMSGFEGDQTQEGIDADLKIIRDAIASAEGRE